MSYTPAERRTLDPVRREAQKQAVSHPERRDPFDEATLNVGQQNVLNRLQAFPHAQGLPKNRRDRLRRTLSDLYGRCSAGTHAEVTVEEARFVFLQTYVALGEILALGDTETTPGDQPEA